MGGSDQWGNIVSGIELIRRVEGAECYGLTFPLVTTNDGKKMGKTEKGALFLDPEMTSPYEFFQYFRNVADADVLRFLLMFTFLPVEECRRLGSLKDAALNEAKERLAWEVTSLIHGKEEANKALAAARAAFRGEGDATQLPTTEIDRERLDVGIGALDLFVASGLAPSKNEARRLIQQGGASVNGTKVENERQVFSAKDMVEGAMMLRAGKKRVARVVVKKE